MSSLFDIAFTYDNTNNSNRQILDCYYYSNQTPQRQIQTNIQDKDDSCSSYTDNNGRVTLSEKLSSLFIGDDVKGSVFGDKLNAPSIHGTRVCVQKDERTEIKDNNISTTQPILSHQLESSTRYIFDGQQIINNRTETPPIYQNNTDNSPIISNPYYLAQLIRECGIEDTGSFLNPSTSFTNSTPETNNNNNNNNMKSYNQLEHLIMNLVKTKKDTILSNNMKKTNTILPRTKNGVPQLPLIRNCKPSRYAPYRNNNRRHFPKKRISM